MPRQAVLAGLGSPFAEFFVHRGERNAIENEFNRDDLSVCDRHEFDAADGAAIGICDEIVCDARAVAVGENICDVVSDKRRQKAIQGGKPFRFIAGSAGEIRDQLVCEKIANTREVVGADSFDI